MRHGTVATNGMLAPLQSATVTPMDQLVRKIVKCHGLTDTQREQLRSALETIRKEIERHRKLEPLAATRSMRKRAIQRLVDRLEATRKELNTTEHTMTPILQETVLPVLGRYLTYTGLVEISEGRMDSSSQIELDRLQGDDRQRGNVISAAQLDQHTVGERIGIAQQIGVVLVQGLLLRLETPLRHLLRLESAYRGGRPQKLYRNYVIQELGRIFPDIFGKRPTTTVTGAFSILCTDVLQALEIEVRDLKSTIPRVLQNAGLMPKARAKRPKASTPRS